MNLMDALYKRKSVRKYLNKQLPAEVFEEMQNIIQTAERLYPEIPMNIHIVKEGEKIHKISSGFIGSYGKIEAPHYLVVTSEEKEGYLENIGFTLENVVLQLTEMNIGTCWIGGSINKSLLKNIITIEEKQFPVIVLSFGTPEKEEDLKPKTPDSYKRKALKDIIKGDLNSDWTYIMNAVRVAPSAVNFQPWRYIIDRNSVDLYVAKKLIITKHIELMQKIDAGISLSHLNIACKDKGISLSLKPLDGKLRKDMNYIISGTF